MFPFIFGAIVLGIGTYFGTRLGKKIEGALTTRAADMPLDDALTADQKTQLRFLMLNAQRPGEIDSALLVLGTMGQASGQQFPLAKAALIKRRSEITL